MIYLWMYQESWFKIFLGRKPTWKIFYLFICIKNILIFKFNLKEKKNGFWKEKTINFIIFRIFFVFLIYRGEFISWNWKFLWNGAYVRLISRIDKFWQMSERLLEDFCHVPCLISKCFRFFTVSFNIFHKLIKLFDKSTGKTNWICQNGFVDQCFSHFFPLKLIHG